FGGEHGRGMDPSGRTGRDRRGEVGYGKGHHDDPERDREYQQLVRDELLERRLTALATVEATLDADELTEEQLGAWLSSLNDLRLVLGTRLDVGEELLDVEADDPDAPAYAVYEYLGFLLSEVVDALTEGLPPATDADV
ncbi:MAG: DUF2017 family protein, partial [Acidimicrobiales bacterium]